MTKSSRSGGDRSLDSDAFPEDGGPVMPAGQSEAFNAKWCRLVSQIPIRSLRQIDEHQLEILVTLLVHTGQLAAMLAADPSDQKTRRLYLQTSQSVSRLSAQFGLSIFDRQRLRIEPEPVEDAFQQWMESDG